MRLCDDALIPQYKKLVDIIHAEQTPAITQLALGAYYREKNGHFQQIEPDDMTEEDIHYVIRQFIDAAVRAEKAGFDGVLFRKEENLKTDTVMIAITGIHGNFYSNPFYYNIGDTLNSENIVFIYAQTNDAFGQIETVTVNTAHDGDFSQAEKITHTGALLVGTYDNFTDGDPSDFLRNLNAHMPTANKLIFIEKTGHACQMKNQEVADDILVQLKEWNLSSLLPL